MTDYYVSPSGSDSNAGTPSHPFLNFAKGANLTVAGDTVHFASGTYTLASGAFAYSHHSGTSTARITYVSDTPLGAKFVGNNPVGSSGAVLYNDGDYVDIVGFDVTALGGATATRIAIANAGNHSRIINCYGHDIPALPGSSGGAGIDHTGPTTVDNWTIGCIVDNIGFDVNQQVQGIYHSSINGGILNCRVSRVAGYGLHLWHGATGVYVANNLSYNNGTGGGIVGADTGTDQGSYIVNNIFLNNAGYGIRETSGVGVNFYYNNCMFGNATAPFGIIGGGGSAQPTGSILADPGLVNYQPDASGNYHLLSSSPCINTGITLAGISPTTDYDGILRPQGSALDIGPYEYIFGSINPTKVTSLTDSIAQAISDFNTTFTTGLVTAQAQITTGLGGTSGSTLFRILSLVDLFPELALLSVMNSVVSAITSYLSGLTSLASFYPALYPIFDALDTSSGGLPQLLSSYNLQVNALFANAFNTFINNAAASGYRSVVTPSMLIPTPSIFPAITLDNMWNLTVSGASTFSVNHVGSNATTASSGAGGGIGPFVLYKVNAFVAVANQVLNVTYTRADGTSATVVYTIPSGMIVGSGTLSDGQRIGAVGTAITAVTGSALHTGDQFTLGINVVRSAGY